MSFPITKGYGGGAALMLLSVNAFADRLELNFNVTVLAVGLAADPSAWSATTAVPSAPLPTFTSVVVSGSQVKLYMTEVLGSALYVLNIPLVGLKDLSSNPYLGPFTANFVGVGSPPYVVLAAAEDSYHAQVIFSEPVVVAEALVPANYVITGGGGLTVYEVTQVDPKIFKLRTSLQDVGQSYTLTVSNIHDMLGNLI